MNAVAQVTGGRIETPSVEYSAILPMLILVGGALVILVISSLVRRRPPALATGITVISGLGALGSAADLWQDVSGPNGAPMRVVADAVVVDGFAVFFTVVIAIAVVLGSLVADGYLRREGLSAVEFNALLLLSAFGGLLMAAANDLIVLFLGLEILSIALYVLAGFHDRRPESREAAIKYFVLGSFSSAVFLYGVALTYGATGSTNLPNIATWLAQNVVTSNGVLLAGMALMVVGLGFKVAAVPFHTWTPDVYQGSPSPVTGFMAAAAKAAGFAALLRVFFSTFSVLRLDWQPIIFVLAVLSLLVGSAVAVVQTDVKRMLAYSSISHAGYVLIGLEAASQDGIAGALFYLLAYTFMIVGSFAIITVVGRRGDASHDLDTYRGLASSRPGLALAFTVLLMAQAGIPFTSGFLAKFYVIAAAVDSRSYALAVIGMLAAAVAAFFYLRLIVLMYSAREDAEAETAATPGGRLVVPGTLGVALASTLVFTMFAGVLPQPVIDFARHATLFG